MANSELHRAMDAEYDRRREADRAEEARRLAQAEAECPELAALLQERRTLIFSGLQGILQGTVSAGDLPGRMAALNRMIGEQLIAHGHPADWLEPVFQCPHCRDTGYVGEPIREPCACRVALQARLQARAMGLNPGAETFAAYDVSVFPDDGILPGTPFTQRQQMQMISRKLARWSARCPDCEKKTLVLSGKSGLGKTWLLRCITNDLQQRGVPCLLTSAYSVQEAARKAAFGGEEDAWDAMLTTAAVLIDDLGSEPLYQNVTVEQLYQLVERRQQAGLCTVFSTNLSEEELQKRYTERIASRLTDLRGCEWIPLAGVDIRRR